MCLRSVQVIVHLLAISWKPDRLHLFMFGTGAPFSVLIGSLSRLDLYSACAEACDFVFSRCMHVSMCHVCMQNFANFAPLEAWLKLQVLLQ